MAQTLAPRTWFTPRQKQFLAVVSQDPTFQKDFYLTGGTALSAVYYNHRESEDLDLFSPQEFPDSYPQTLLFKSQTQLKWVKIRRRQQHGANNYILTFKDQSELNLDFLYFPFPHLQPTITRFNINIDSLIDIATNKFDALMVRKKARDFVDLYTILKREHLNLRQLRHWHHQKFEIDIDPKEISTTFLRVNEVTILPRMKIPFSRQRMIDFFEHLADRLKPEIFK